MIIDVSSVNQEHFLITDHVIAGEECSFIRMKPSMTEWNESNVHLRSCIVNSKGELISASYPKFFNFGEREEIFPFSGNLEHCSFIEKIDGSTLIVSKYNGELIIRTRGTVDANGMENGGEIEFFKKKYSTFFNEYVDKYNVSYIFEWVSPKNRIVISHSEPELYLTNRISHYDYSLSYQDTLDEMPFFLRPTRFRFSNLLELLETVKKFDTMEGICLYYDDDQHIRKVKSEWYLKAHAFKSQVNLKTMLDLYQSWKPLNRKEFEDKIASEFDYECLGFAKPMIEELYRRLMIISIKIHDIEIFVNENKDLPQKEFAFKVKSTYSGTLGNLAFSLRKNPILSDIQIKTLVLEYEH